MVRTRLNAVVLASGLALAAAGILTTPAASAPQQTVYVAPNGDDAHDGTSAAQAVRTPQRAQELLRGLIPGMTGDIAVSLANGVYSLSAPLQLTAADSGANGHQVVWTAAPGARPVFSGGGGRTRRRTAARGENTSGGPPPPPPETRPPSINGHAD